MHPSHEAMGTEYFSGIKKACGNEAIGETVALPNRHTIMLLSVGKGKEKK